MVIRYKGMVLEDNACMLRHHSTLIDSHSKYVWNFDVYCGVSHLMEGQLIVNKGKPKQGMKVVKRLLDYYWGHACMMDTFFMSGKLFHDWEKRGICATGLFVAILLVCNETLHNLRHLAKIHKAHKIGGCM